MNRFALLLLLAACTGPDDDTGDTDASDDADSDGYSVAEGDCDDGDAAIHPGATETYYDGVDQDCSGGSDDDADGDGHDALAQGGDDCDDADAEVHPGATETYYDGSDDDCDGASDYDADGDGYDASTFGGSDCDDTRAGVHPGAEESCGTPYDDDCEGGANEADAADAPTWYLDFDEDAHGGPEESVTACVQPAGYVASGDDCDDQEGAVHPGATTVACDGFDNDCDAGTFEPAAIQVDGVATVQTLAAVLAAATGGEVITLCEGRHTLASVSIADGLALEGKGMALTILDGGGTSPLLRVTTTDEVAIADLTLTGGIGFLVGDDRLGGGLHVGDGGDVSLTDVAITGNSGGYGGGLYVGDGAEVTANRVRISGNVGGTALPNPIGGGMWLDDGSTLSAHDLTVEDNDSTACGGVHLGDGAQLLASGRSIVTANVADDHGGGVCLSSGSAVSGLTISANEAPVGAGVHVVGAPSAADLADTVVADNVAADLGGGLYGTGAIDLARVVFDGNTADAGGNLYLAGETTGAVMDGGSIRRGTAAGTPAEGGGVFLDDADFQSIAVDWGAEETDNTPSDLHLDEANLACPIGIAATFTIDDEAGASCPNP